MLSFELCISESYNTKDVVDEWGCAFVYGENGHGVEYNFCRDQCGDHSAIYYFKTEEYLSVNYDQFVPYEIDFESETWEDELKEKMVEVFNDFESKEV